MPAKLNKVPACHPKRKYWAKDLCAVCYRRTWLSKKNPTYTQDYDLKRHYGISLAQYNNLLAAQGGVCAICKSPPTKKRLSVDHDHKTKKVRGLLCWRCNYRLLASCITPERLRAAATYLEQHA